MHDRAYVPHPLRPYAPLVINAALTGMVASRERVPHLPVSGEQIIADAVSCAERGAQVVHLHARRTDGSPDWERAAYEEIILGIRERVPDLVCCVSTGGRREGSVDRRADVLGLEGAARPDMASLTLGSLNFRDGASAKAPETIAELARRMRAAAIKPELEVFDAGMAYAAHRLIERELLEPPLWCNLLPGNEWTAPATAGNLAALVDALPAGFHWAGAGLGAFQLAINATAIFMGGHVRTGLEDAPFMDAARTEHATNGKLVARCAQLAAIAGRRLATRAEARAMLGLAPVPGRDFALRPAVLPADRGAILAMLETVNFHRIPGPEMHDLDLGEWHVAERDGRLVGVAGFDLLFEGEELIGKTTLLAVDPAERGGGIGRALQELRMDRTRELGCGRVRTNADRPETIAWYERHFGYCRVGTVPKLAEFGLPDVEDWTTLEASLELDPGRPRR